VTILRGGIGEARQGLSGSRIAQAIRYALKHRAGLTVFLGDGRVEIDSNVVERSIRPIALNRKIALYAGSDQGGVHWGVIASLIETAKLNAIPIPISPTS
jgi:transposase